MPKHMIIMGPIEKPDRRKSKRPSDNRASGTVMIDLDVNTDDPHMFRLKGIPFYNMDMGYDGQGQKRKRVR